jgi:heat shock protein HslJ
MSAVRMPLLVLASVAALGACGSDDPGGSPADPTAPTPTTAPKPGLGATSWLLTGWYDGSDLADAASPASLELSAGGELAGSTGCNRFAGSWAADDSSLSVTLGPLTLAGCVDPLAADQEQAVIAAMESTTSFEGGAENLVLLDADGNPLLEYAAVSDDLAGTSWQATGINNGTGGVEATANTPLATVDFEEGGSASGSGGCNGFTATWRTDGGSISITELSITEMSCGPELDSLETQFVAALQAGSTYTVSGTALELRDDSGALQVSFGPAA